METRRVNMKRYRFLDAAVTAIFLAVLFILPVNAAEAEKKTAAPATQSLSANADDAWKEIETASRPPAPPAAWAGKPPTPEQRAEFSKFLGDQSALVAAKAKEFYTRFPNHPKAEDARKREQRFLQQAVQLGNTTVVDLAAENLTDEQKIQQKINAITRKAMEKRAQGTAAVAKELESGLRQLMKEHPDRPEPWQQLLLVARNTLDKEEQKKLLNEIVKSTVADEGTVAAAKGALRAVGAIGQPLEIAFTAADGRKVDIQKMKGKVVLVDFWAAWCGPCIASLPEVVNLFNQYHEKGFEIVGINLDKRQRDMEQVVHKFQMPWPQYFDGKGWGAKYVLEYNVNAIPSMWLVDKKGILRTMNARENLEEQVKELLAEQL